MKFKVCLHEDKSKFNNFYHTVDEYGTLLGQWMDNGLVFCVSTVHKVGSVTWCTQKKPRKTIKNSKHVDKVWGEDNKKRIHIPKLIDNYNHWMGSVDLADQRVAYYIPNLYCHCNWVPLFLQLISLVRVKAYMMYKSITNSQGKKSISHKKVTLHIIK